MTSDSSNPLSGKELLSPFEGEEFRSTQRLKEYLCRQREEKTGCAMTEEQQRRFDFVIQLTSLMSQVRFCAEDWNRSHAGVARDRRQELPLPAGEMQRILLGEKDDSPDQQIITRIAQNDQGLVTSLMEGMRRVLHRERQMVSVGNAQQLDAYCLQWLTKQPGRTAAEKAGMRQRIMAVVREESLDTLENRVFKSFMERCQRSCWDYLKQFDGEKYASSQRIKDVKTLQRMCQEFLKRPEIAAIPGLSGIPYPNYVLRDDKRYSRMWEYYQQLVRQTRMVELVWPFRHRLFFEGALAMMVCKLEELAQKRGMRPFLQKLYWLKPFPKEGTFFNKTRWGNLYADGELQMAANAGTAHFKEPFFCDSTLRVQFVPSSRRWSAAAFSCVFLYLPEGCPERVCLDGRAGSTLYIAYAESTHCQLSCVDKTCDCLCVESLETLREELSKLDNILGRYL